MRCLLSSACLYRQTSNRTVRIQQTCDGSRQTVWVQNALRKPHKTTALCAGASHLAFADLQVRSQSSPSQQALLGCLCSWQSSTSKRCSSSSRSPSRKA